MGIEGLKRQWGVHAAGVIMSSEPLADVIPLLKRPADGAMITQFDYPTCEALGLIKMDFLGLRNLTVLDDALHNIEANRGETVVLEDLALDDEATYQLLAARRHPRRLPARRRPDAGAAAADAARHLRRHLRGRRALPARPDGRGLAQQLRPAQERPRAGRRRSTPSWPSRSRRSSDETYGLIVYQEQIMAIAQKVAGYTLGQADLLRKAMGKKKKEILDAEYVPFSEGMKANGYSEAAIKALWDTLVPFSDYAFNKAHTASYGLISYWTAYLKAHYPRRIHGGPAHLGAATTRTSPRSTSTSAAG